MQGFIFGLLLPQACDHEDIGQAFGPDGFDDFPRLFVPELFVQFPQLPP